MATYYIDPTNGNDSDDGLSWANAKLTLNGAEDIPVAAGDTVYVGPGVYRELLTVDVSGTSGNEITYIGDTTGENTDGVGGIVRITGSNDDLSATRAQCINASSKNFRVFRGFVLDSTTTNEILMTNCTDWVLEDCVFAHGEGNGINSSGASQVNHIIRHCWFIGNENDQIFITHSSATTNTNWLIENCIFFSSVLDSIQINLVGGIVIKNCTFLGAGDDHVDVQNSAGTSAGEFTEVYNSIFSGAAGTVFEGAVSGDIIEDYNNLWANITDRTNVSTGPNSTTYPPLFSMPLLYSGIQFPFTCFSLSKWSPINAISGSGESTDDFYGFTRPTSASGKSWGAIQFQDSERETSRIRSGCAAWVLNNAGLVQQFVPVTNVSTTFSTYVNRSASYDGATCPQMIIRQPGVSDDTTTDTGAASVWNELTTTLTPAANPPYVTVLLKSNNTAGSSGSGVGVYWDDLTVS